MFTRNHDDLFMSHTINITEALCGFKMVVKQLDGRMLVLNHPQGEILPPGSIRAIPNEGMPIYKSPFDKGNMYVKFDIKFPENNSLSEDAIKVNHPLFFLSFLILSRILINNLMTRNWKTSYHQSLKRKFRQANMSTRCPWSSTRTQKAARADTVRAARAASIGTPTAPTTRKWAVNASNVILTNLSTIITTSWSQF